MVLTSIFDATEPMVVILFSVPSVLTRSSFLIFFVDAVTLTVPSLLVICMVFFTSELIFTDSFFPSSVVNGRFIEGIEFPSGVESSLELELPLEGDLSSLLSVVLLSSIGILLLVLSVVLLSSRGILLSVWSVILLLVLLVVLLSSTGILLSVLLVVLLSSIGMLLSVWSVILLSVLLVVSLSSTGILLSVLSFIGLVFPPEEFPPPLDDELPPPLLFVGAVIFTV